MQRRAQPLTELHVDRQVEPEDAPQLGHAFGRDVLAHADEPGDHVPRDRAHEQEHDQRDAEQGGQREQEAASDVGEHRVGRIMACGNRPRLALSTSASLAQGVIAR